MRVILFLMLLLPLAVACSNEDSSLVPPVGGGDPPSDSEETPSAKAPEVIYASKSYSPSTWVDFKENYSSLVSITLAAIVEVEEGRSGNHWITLKLEDGSMPMICIYKGSGSLSKTASPCSSNNGLKYDFHYCIDREAFNANTCASNPMKAACVNNAADIQAGEVLEVNYIELSVNNGDSCGTTKVKMELSSTIL